MMIKHNTTKRMSYIYSEHFRELRLNYASGVSDRAEDKSDTFMSIVHAVVYLGYKSALQRALGKLVPLVRR